LVRPRTEVGRFTFFSCLAPTVLPTIKGHDGVSAVCRRQLGGALASNSGLVGLAPCLLRACERRSVGKIAWGLALAPWRLALEIAVACSVDPCVC
jgi:hypothetical protein